MDFILLKHQGAALRVFSEIFINLLLKRVPKRPPNKNTTIRRIHTPNPVLTNHFHEWLDRRSKYQTSIAPHFFPQWSFPALYQLLRNTNIPLHRLMNQGCTLEVFNPICTTSKISLECELGTIKKESHKTTITQHITCEDSKENTLIKAQIYSVFTYGKRQKNQQRNDIEKINFKDSHIFPMSFTNASARKYGYLSGDINPIHMSKAMARLMGFRNSLIHGFALLSHSFELIEERFGLIRIIDIRFIKPVYLNQSVSLVVPVALKTELSSSFYIFSDDKKTLHAIGSIVLNKALTHS